MVLAFQKRGTTTLGSFAVPKGKENALRAAIATGRGIKYHEYDLDADEIKGVLSQKEYQNLKALFPDEATPAKQTFLEMGKALKAKQSLDKWKKHVV